MMYGSMETLEQRVEHLQRVRDLQDETGGFTAFIAWSFQSQGTELKVERPATGYDYLRTTAVSRLFLDNVASLQSSWVTQGPKIGQLSLHFGCNDFGSTMMEENVVSAAGTCFSMPITEIHRLIEEAGYRPQRRNTLYEWLPTPAPPDLPAARLASPAPAPGAPLSITSGYGSVRVGVAAPAASAAGATAAVGPAAGSASVGSPADGDASGADPIPAPRQPAVPPRFEPTPHARRVTRPDALDILNRTLNIQRSDT
jgi:hypothetical protein